MDPQKIITHAIGNRIVHCLLISNTNVCTKTEHIKHLVKLFRCTPPAYVRNNIKLPVNAKNSGIICKYIAIPKQTRKQLNISIPI